MNVCNTIISCYTTYYILLLFLIFNKTVSAMRVNIYHRYVMFHMRPHTLKLTHIARYKVAHISGNYACQYLTIPSKIYLLTRIIHNQTHDIASCLTAYTDVFTNTLGNFLT